VGDTSGTKKRVTTLIFTTPICLHSQDFAIEHSFNKGLELLKEVKYFRLVLKKIDPREFTKIVNEAGMILFIAKRINDRASNIGKISSKGALERPVEIG
jgi:hypothetical protein